MLLLIASAHAALAACQKGSRNFVFSTLPAPESGSESHELDALRTLVAGDQHLQ